MFQDFRLIRHLSAFDNVALPLRVAGASDEEVEGPVREMLAWVGLADRASARPPTLSGGAQQRVAIARAVINRPDLLVADEPTGNVDSEMATRLLHLFTALNGLGTTVVVATHDVGLISATPGAQLIRLENGGLVDPTGTIAQSTAEESMSSAWLLPSAADRRLLGIGGFRGPTPWVIAIMSFSILIVAATGLMLANAAGALTHAIEARYALEVPNGGEDLNSLIAALKSEPGVTSVDPVRESDMRQTLERWLGPAAQSPGSAGPGADQLRHSSRRRSRRPQGKTS